MASVQPNGVDLLDAVKRMSREEFDQFIEEAVAMRPPPKRKTLSAEETTLIERINRGVSPETAERYSQLIERRKKGTLSTAQRHELLQLTHVVESQDADRAAALLELSKFRHVPLRVLMKQMGIRTPAIHG